MTEQEKYKLIRQKLLKSVKTLDEINNLLQFGYNHNAINRIYYASFYAVSALLLTIDISPKSHSGVRSQFNFHFVKEGKIPKELEKFFTRIFDERLFADYEDFSEYDNAASQLLFSNAKEFIRHIEKLIEGK